MRSHFSRFWYPRVLPRKGEYMSIQSLLLRVAVLAGLCWSSLAPVYSQTDTSHPGTKAAGKAKPATKKTSRGTQERGVKPADQPADPSPSIGAYYALVIGINNYRSPVPKLKTAVYDAREVAKLLQESYGFAKPKLLENPTRRDIIIALNEYRRLPAKSNLLIYYAGHGQRDPRTNKAYWLPADADLNSDVNWISASTITEEIGAIPAEHVLLISDSCYSGELTRGLPPPQINAVERQSYFRKMLESPSRTLMSSGRNEPVADDGSAGHSRFAYVLLASLQQIDEDTFTAAYLFQTHVQQAVGGELGSEQVPQYAPIMNSGHQWGDFVFSRKGGKRPVINLDAGRAGNNGDYPDHPEGGKRVDVNLSDSHSSGDIDADRNAIKDAINRYADAYSTKDVNAIGQIWTNMPAKFRKDLDNSFNGAKAITLTVGRVATVIISPDGKSATARAQLTQSYVPKDGSPAQNRDYEQTFTLTKAGGAWTITDRK